MERKKLSFKKLKVDNKNSNSDNGDNLVDIEEEEPDMLNMEIDFGDKKKRNNVDEIENEEQLMNEDTNIVKADYTAEEWQRELEKMSSKLKLDNNVSFNKEEWRGRLENLKQFDTVT